MPNNKSIPEAQDDIIKADENKRFASIEEQKAGGALPYKQSPFPLVQGTSGHTSALKQESELEAEGDQVSLMSGFDMENQGNVSDTNVGNREEIEASQIDDASVNRERSQKELDLMALNESRVNEKEQTVYDPHAKQLDAMKQANPIARLFTGIKPKGSSPDVKQEEEV